MSEAKFTLGPWKFTPLLSGSENDRGFRVYSEHGGSICDVWPRNDARGDASPTGWANARLIVAAPELLEVAQALTAALGAAWDMGKLPPAAVVADLLAKARDAIAKAGA